MLLAVLALPSAAFAMKGRVVDQQGRPVANATISVLGRPGEAKTDADGRFEWQPDPAPPFEVLVIDSAGSYSRPILIEEYDPVGELLVTIAPLLSESVTVSGSAPSIEATPAAGTTSVSGRDVAVRQPTNLMQALENVAGINQVSEGQAAVPAIRGLARGRTLILIDGARVSSERRAGASATFLDPSLIEGVDVARGPGSVAYGSDAFGGVISVRTRRVAPGSPLAAQFSGTLGAGVPERRGSIEGLEGRGRRRVPPGGAHAPGRRLGQSRGRGVQLGILGPRLSVPRRNTSGRRRSHGRMAERFRPRDRAATQQLAHGAVLLSDRRLAPLHRRIRSPGRWGLSTRRAHRFSRKLRAGHRSGSVRDGDHRPQHRAR